MLRRIAARFDGQDGSRPFLVVDDAHLLDDASAAALHHVALRTKAFLLVTIRYGERCPDAVTALWKDGIATRVDLPPLSDEAVDALLHEAFGDRMDPVSRRRLVVVSAGNPLLLRETLRAGLETGALRSRHGEWSWSGEVRATRRLTDVVAARVTAADRRVVRVLELVACGEPLGVALLTSLCDAEAVADAERLGLVVVAQDGQRAVARLSHPLYGEVIRSTMARTRAATVHGDLAAAITATPMRRRDDALLAGVWQLRSGRLGDAAVLVAAAREALLRLDNTLAARLARAARDAGGGLPAERVLAQVLSHCGWYEESVRAMPEGTADADEDARIRWATVRSDNLYWGEGKVAEAERILDEAGSAPGRRAAEGNRAFILMFDSRCAESLKAGEAVLSSGDAEPQAIVWAATGAAASAGILGDLVRAKEIYRHGLAVAEAHAEALPWGRVQVCSGYFMGLVAAGRVRDAATLAEREYTSAASTGVAELRGPWAGFRGVAAKARGDMGTAVSELRTSLRLLAAYDTFRLAAPCLAELAGATAIGGDPGYATRVLDRAHHPGRWPSRLFQPWMELDRAWTFAAAGDTTTAAATARRASVQARYLGQPTVEAWALYDAARLGDARVVHSRLAALATAFPVTTTFARAAEAMARQDAAALERAAAAFADQGLLLHAAEVAARAACLHRAAGHRTRATTAAELAKELSGQCATALTPLLRKGMPATEGLTRREREVVSLAAAGRTSRDIATYLGLSTRTIDNHLGRAYTKLGIRGRAELPRHRTAD